MSGEAFLWHAVWRRIGRHSWHHAPRHVFCAKARGTLAIAWQRSLALVQSHVIQARLLRLERCRKNLSVCGIGQMGAALFIALEKPIEGLDSFVNGKAVSRESDAIERALAKIEQPSLFDFFNVSDDEAAAMFEDVPDDFEPTVPDDAWHPAADGLALFTTLADFVAANRSQFKEPDALAEDVADFVRVLSSAAEHGVRWRLCPDF